MFALRSSRGIVHRWSQHQQHWLFSRDYAAMEVVFNTQLTLGSLGYPGTDNNLCTPVDHELWWLSSRVMSHEHRTPGLVGFHTIQEIVAPGLSRGRIHQVFDVNGGEDGMPCTELFARLGLDAYTPTALE